jgi:hypothetical protein
LTGIRFYDDNDRFNLQVSLLSDGTLALDPTLESDIVTYLKGRFAQVPGAGTVHAAKVTETVSYL